jgi:hypothetical protein
MRLTYAFLLVVLAGCSKPAPGSESGPCYPNDTCNAGLACMAGTCIAAGSDGGSVDDMATMGGTDLAGADSANYNDAGMPCPGASIFHPGTETRMVNMSVPFVGRGRDAMCNAITGANLVWTDSIEGQIGTGETFNYTFTMTGTHTVTLDAKDGANDYLAMITFQIN